MTAWFSSPHSCCFPFTICFSFIYFSFRFFLYSCHRLPWWFFFLFFCNNIVNTFATDDDFYNYHSVLFQHTYRQSIASHITLPHLPQPTICWPSNPTLPPTPPHRSTLTSVHAVASLKNKPEIPQLLWKMAALNQSSPDLPSGSRPPPPPPPPPCPLLPPLPAPLHLTPRESLITLCFPLRFVKATGMADCLVFNAMFTCLLSVSIFAFVSWCRRCKKKSERKERNKSEITFCAWKRFIPESYIREIQGIVMTERWIND